MSLGPVIDSPVHVVPGESFLMVNGVGGSGHLKKSPLSPGSTGQPLGLRSPTKLLHLNSSGRGLSLMQCMSLKAKMILSSGFDLIFSQANLWVVYGFSVTL